MDRLEPVMWGTAVWMTKADLILAPSTQAPSKARQLLAEVLDDRSGSEALARAQLALSEVITNAVRHGGANGAGEITLHLERTDDLLSVRVVQPGPPPPRPSIASMPDPWATSGYGLGIVDAIADRWGVHLDPPSVWFELRLR
jgi:anti-sigma regulatory factor (Ser/Thr protein kinase)